MKRLAWAAPAALLMASMAAAPLGAQELPALSDELLGRTGAALHVDVQTGRVAGITSSGPVAEVGAKIVDVLFGDYAAGEWIGYEQRVEGDYVKPAVSQRLVLLRRDGVRGVLLDEEFSPTRRDALVGRLAEYRRKAELLTGEMHVPDYLLLSHSRSVQDGQMKWWLHERVNYGYTEAGLKTLNADLARVRAAQAEKAARETGK